MPTPVSTLSARHIVPPQEPQSTPKDYGDTTTAESEFPDYSSTELCALLQGSMAARINTFRIQQQANHRIIAGQNAPSPVLTPDLAEPALGSAATTSSRDRLLALAPGMRSEIQRLYDRSPEGSLAHENCRQALEALDRFETAMNSSAATAETGDHHGGGAIVVDVDEAIHGLYAALYYLVQAIKEGGGRVVEHFIADAALLQSDPLAWVLSQNVPHNIADVAMAATVGVLLTPFALIAVKAGIEEMVASYGENKRLDSLRSELETRLVRLNKFSTDIQESNRLMSLQGQQVKQRLVETAFSKRQNQDNGLIGLCSAASGSCITANVLVGAATKLAHLATHGAPAAAVATGAAAVAGTYVIGPFAAVTAAVLAWHMLQKSTSLTEAFGKDRLQTLERLSLLMPQALNHCQTHPAHLPPKALDDLVHYLQFIDDSMAKNERFLTRFRGWSKAFLVGSSVYTAGTLAKLGLVAAAALGATLLTGPGALAATILLGGVGGLVMGVGSWTFLAGHHRLLDLERYYKQDDPELDRHFLTLVDLLRAADTAQEILPSELQGLLLRSDFFQQMYQREEARADFLQRVAKATGKRYAGQLPHTEDSPRTVDADGKTPSLRQRLGQAWRDRLDSGGARLAATAAFVKTLGKGPGRAVEAARRRWNEQRPIVRKNALTRWVGSDNGSTPQMVTLMNSMLTPQLSFIQQRLDLKLQTYDAASRSLAAHLPGADPATAAGLAQTLAEMDAELSRDEALYYLLSDTREQLDRFDSLDERQQARLINRFVTGQQGRSDDSVTAPASLPEAYNRLWKHLLDDAPQRYRELRGMLQQTEMQAARLHAAVAAEREGVTVKGEAVRIPDSPTGATTYAGEVAVTRL